MINSFRLRLALLSATLCGLALVAFGLGTFWLIRDIKIERIDGELKTLAEREANRLRDANDWPAPLVRIGTSMGIRNPAHFAVLVQDGNGETLFQSPGWPTQLPPESLQWPTDGTAPPPSASADLWISSAYAEPILLAQAARGPDAATGGGQGGNFAGGPPPAFGPGGGPGGSLAGGPPPGPGPGGRPPFPRMPPRAGTEPPPPAQGVAPGAASTSAADDPAPANSQGTAFDGASPIAPVAPTDAPALSQEPDQSRARARRTHASTVAKRNVAGHEWHLGLATTDAGRVAIGVDMVVIDDDMRGIRNAFLLALPFALVLVGLGSWLVASRALGPLRKLTATARRVTAQGLDQRIAAKGEDREFVELIEVFNRMLERLERSFKQAHRFSADAAHELKTPLAILQGQLERAINAADAGSPLQAGLTGILDEVRRLSTISRKLLLLSQADAGRLAIHREPIDLSVTLTELIEDVRMLAPNLEVSGEVKPGLEVQVDGSLILQVLHNLISNAIKYNVPDGWIRISTVSWMQRIEIRVSNKSTGIPAAERGRIFERFFRADPAHSRDIEGVGLGLSLSREIARAHGGDLTLAEVKPDSVTFSLILPLS